MKQFKKDDKVIVRNNEDEPYKIGTFVEYADLSNCPDDVPMVIFDGDEKPYMCFGITIPYSEDIKCRLDRLTPGQQWTLLTLIRENKDGKQFILMHGLPGSGKSTKAKILAGQQGQVFSTDDYFYLNEEQEYRFNASLLGRAHSWNQGRSLDAMNAGIPIVVIDNTNTTVREMRSYLDHIHFAKRLGYQVLIEEPDTEWQFDVDELFARGSHNVPQKHIQKMLDRYVKDVQVEDIMFEK